MTTRSRILTAAAAALALPVLAASPAHAAQGNFLASGSDWPAAASLLGQAGSLWAPAKTYGLSLHGPVDVVADNLTFLRGSAARGDTAASAMYGDWMRGFQVSEKWAGTGWAAEPAYDSGMGLVGTVTLRLGAPGTRAKVKAKVFANCKPAAKAAQQPGACSAADVKRTGGVLQLTARPSSTMSAPGDTTVVVQTIGLSYDTLLGIAGSLAQASGQPDAASAQTHFTCLQMTQDRMPQADAEAYAASNGFTTRLGSIDGVAGAVTADYRPDRLTLDVSSGVVTGCTGG